MIDSTIIWVSDTESIVVPKQLWEQWCVRFADIICSTNALSCNKNKKARIVDMGGEYQLLSVWGQKAIMRLMFPNLVAMMNGVQYSQEGLRGIPLNDMALHVFHALHKCSTVASILNSTCQRRYMDECDNSMAEQEKVQASIRSYYDEVVNLDVQFIVTKKLLHQLYYIVGAELHFIDDVRKYSTNNDVCIGTLLE